MSIEEMKDYCKLLFKDYLFIDMLVNFCKTSEKNTNDYTIYVSEEKITKLNEIINNLPLIIQRDANISNSVHKVINYRNSKKDEIDDKI
jgi:hypothetical protein